METSSTHKSQSIDNMILVINYQGKTLGVYNNQESARIFIQGCRQNGFIRGNVEIHYYYPNSCYCINVETMNDTTSKYPVSSVSTIEKIVPNLDSQDNMNEIKNEEKNQTKEIKSTDLVNNEIYEETIKFTNSDKYLEMAKQKIDLQHKINMLKIHKKKIEESKSAYENDIKLFELFTQNQKKDPNFVIPEIFDKKFKLMSELNKNNNLSWENFVKEYQQDGVNNYNELFSLNSYEEMFLEPEEDNNNDEFSEELDIESDSSTDTSGRCSPSGIQDEFRDDESK